jgi:hypothetical protein
MILKAFLPYCLATLGAQAAVTHSAAVTSLARPSVWGLRMPSSDAAACQIAQSITRRLIVVEQLFEEIDYVFVSREVDRRPGG